MSRDIANLLIFKPIYLYATLAYCIQKGLKMTIKAPKQKPHLIINEVFVCLYFYPDTFLPNIKLLKKYNYFIHYAQQ
jgi:hypothetical protein